MDINRTSNIVDFNNTFNKYFNLDENIRFKTRAKIENDMVINTSNVHNQDLKICNNRDNCIRFNVDSNGFNIIPDLINNVPRSSKEIASMFNISPVQSSIYGMFGSIFAEGGGGTSGGQKYR